MSLKVITYDVEHGNSHVIVTPNNKYLMIDAGSKSDFSPAKHLKNKYGLSNLDWFTLTHHDTDHLTDIDNVFTEIAPLVLHRQKLQKENLLKFYNPITQQQETFLKYEAHYTSPALPISDPTRDWGGVQFAVFSNDWETYDTNNVNNLSIVTFVHFQASTFLFPGDLERDGWLELLKKPDFVAWLEKTDFLVASHHGREAGYCDEIFQHFKPLLTVISDGSETDTSVTYKYSAKSRGMNVMEKNGLINFRSTVSTRSDGALLIEISNEGHVSVNCFKTT